MNNMTIFEQDNYHREYITVEFDLAHIERRSSTYSGCQNVKAVNGVWYPLNTEELYQLSEAYVNQCNYNRRPSRIALHVINKENKPTYYTASIDPYIIEKTKEINKKLLLLN